jgi:hypothetical protein
MQIWKHAPGDLGHEQIPVLEIWYLGSRRNSLRALLDMEFFRLVHNHPSIT